MSKSILLIGGITNDKVKFIKTIEKYYSYLCFEISNGALHQDVVVQFINENDELKFDILKEMIGPTFIIVGLYPCNTKYTKDIDYMIDLDDYTTYLDLMYKIKELAWPKNQI